MVLGGVTTTRRSEIDWLYRAVAPLFPAQWARCRAGVLPADRDGDLVAAYHRLLQDPDPAMHMQAAKAWCEWESALVAVDPEATPDPGRWQPAFQLACARLVTHYFHHNAWLEEGMLLRHASALAHIPGILVHGRLDLGSPLVTAWALAQAWPHSELVIVSGAGYAEFMRRSNVRLNSAPFIAARIADHVHPSHATTRILDLGCNDGAMTSLSLTELVKRSSAQAFQVTLVDPAAEALANAAAVISGLGARIQTSCLHTTVESCIHTMAGTYDVITARWIFYPSKPEAIGGLLGMLAQHGLLLVAMGSPTHPIKSYGTLAH